MKNMNIKDIIYVMMIVVGIVSSYFTGQMTTESEITELKLTLKDIRTSVRVNEVKINSTSKKIGEILDNQNKQNEKNDKIIQLIYSIDSHH